MKLYTAASLMGDKSPEQSAQSTESKEAIESQEATVAGSVS